MSETDKKANDFEEEETTNNASNQEWFKEKFNLFKSKVIDFKDKTIDKTAKKVAESKIVIKDNEWLEELIEKSKNTSFKSESWEEKTFTKRSFLIVWNKESDFFKDFLPSIPILLAKSFAQNVFLRFADINNKQIDLSNLDIKEHPSLIIYENKEVYKIISWDENIKKLVKDLTLDINKSIENL